MPLKPGKSKAVINYNTKELIHAGYPPKQASAIAHNKAGQTPKRKTHHTVKRKR